MNGILKIGEKTIIRRAVLLWIFRIYIIMNIVAAAPAGAMAATPAQWIAKMYTNVLGRMPDQDGWQDHINWFDSVGCSQATLKENARGFYLGREYFSLGYDNAARILTLYRGVFNTEPDQAEYDYYLDQLNSGSSFRDMVDSFLDSTEFTDKVPDICSGKRYDFGGRPAITIPTSGIGFTGGTGDELQSILDSSSPGSIVWLAQKAVVRLSHKLTIPGGITLATTGNPDPSTYAFMGRLVRDAAAFNEPVVELEGRAKLVNVWVDGQRGYYGYNYDDLNIRLLGGSKTQVTGCLISDTAGWSSLVAFGKSDGYECSSNYISGNLITVYSSKHLASEWADGLSIACENAIVEHNGIVDATDVGIVIYKATPNVQHSQIRYNTVLNAGNSAFGAFNVDPLGYGGLHNFDGSSIANNMVWTSSQVHIDILLSIGTRAYFGDSSGMGTGVSVTDNSTGTLTARVESGIVVAGMEDSFVQANDLVVDLVDTSGCPSHNVGVDEEYASGGNIQQYESDEYDSCLGEHYWSE
ncbi:MAG: DUF4214 domain-containing protein [Nitrospirae bacterium]|nr:DUF4214 domain-containing protein [Nitrospirota bacterium]